MRTDIVKRKKEILNWINEKRSKAFICKEISCKPETLENFFKKNGIEYRGNIGNKGWKISNIRISALEYLKQDNVKAPVLRKKLIQDGIKKEKCESCGLDKWMERKIPLELHHKDGDRFNNKLENLQILCCNCHALTENYGVKNIKNNRNL